MCIAIYSPKGNPVPCEDYLRSSFLRNDDGAGFAFNLDNHEVQIVKGLMTWEDFIKTFRHYESEYGFKDRGVLIHFRITTHGGTNKECCHPFPLVADAGLMQKPFCRSKYAVIHNGIISLTSYDTRARVKMSDTMVFVEKYLSKLATNRGWFKNKTNFELIYDLIDSKMAVLNGEGEIMATPGFTQDADGNWYSNTSYMEPRVSKAMTCYGGWDDYDWDNEYWSNYGGYYGSTGKSTSKSKSTYRFKSIKLMKLRPGDMVLFADGEYIESETTCPVYVTEDNDVYYGDPEDEFSSGSGIWVKNPIFFDKCDEVVDSNYCEIPFNPDCFASVREEFSQGESSSDSSWVDAYAKQNK